MNAPRDSRRVELLVMGSINMDFLVRVPARPQGGETVIGTDGVWRPGGKGANQAVAAALHGGRVRMIGYVGADAHGRAATTALSRAGVDVSLVKSVEGRATGFAAVLITPDGENSVVVAPGANHAATERDLQALREQIAASPLLLLQMELPPEVVRGAARLATAAGREVVLNLAPAVDGVEAIGANVGTLVVNRAEAARLLRGRVDDVGAAHRAVEGLLRRGPSRVVITLGADGAVAGDRDGVVHVPARPAAVRDTTGAGDAFVGVLAVELSRQAPLRRAVEAASLAGAAAVQAEGAQLSAAVDAARS